MIWRFEKTQEMDFSLADEIYKKPMTFFNASNAVPTSESVPKTALVPLILLFCGKFRIPHSLTDSRHNRPLLTLDLLGLRRLLLLILDHLIQLHLPSGVAVLIRVAGAAEPAVLVV